MSLSKLRIALGAILALSVTSVFAGPIQFDWSDLSGGDYATSEFSDTEGGVTASVRAWDTRDGWENVYVDASGSGESGLGLQSRWYDSDDVDGLGSGQYLRVGFSEEVRITGIRFLDGDHNYNFYRYDDVDVYSGQNLIFNELPIEANDINGWVTFDFVASHIWVGADDYNDSWYLNGLRISTIPEPATIALLSLGLLGLGLGRRKAS